MTDPIVIEQDWDEARAVRYIRIVEKIQGGGSATYMQMVWIYFLVVVAVLASGAFIDAEWGLILVQLALVTVAFAGWVVVVLTATLPASRRTAAQMILPGFPQRLTLDESGLALSSNHFEQQCRWAGFDEVRRENEAVLAANGGLWLCLFADELPGGVTLDDVEACMTEWIEAAR